MMKSKENKLRMYFAVGSVCEKHADEWQNIEVFANNYKKFRDKIPQIKAASDQLLVEGIAMETFKSFDRIELEEIAFYFMGKILAFAKEIKNNKLYNEITDKRTHLSSITDLELISVCSSVANILTNNLQQLGNYDVSTASITDLQHLTSSFSFGLNRVKSSHAKRKSAEENLKKLFRDTDEILKEKLDSYIELFKNGNHDFYMLYKAAREVIDMEISLSSEINVMVGD